MFFTTSGLSQGDHLSPLLFSIFINGLSKALHHCNFLCFADDIKLFMQINSMDDCLKLQHDVNSFVAFFDGLGLSLNFDKCKVMTFNRIRSPRMFSYHLLDFRISCYDGFVLDLGLKISSNLDPGLHIELVCCKALRVLGIIM
jgi:hypothetical protein|uniref:Reverse transcriptase domain-containing protein n=1 Tax=Sipha flava TaxID=143950 RepID=A0A2S2Q882_9HEMI